MASAAMEWWRLVETVRADLYLVTYKAVVLVDAVDSTHAMLWDMHDDPIPPLGGDLHPVAELDSAVGELVRLSALHARAGRILLLFGRFVGLEGGNNAQWLLWDRFHAEARRCGAAALERVRAAAARARAFEDAVRAARSFPPASPGRTGWCEAAYWLQDHAVVSAFMALQFLRDMCRALHREFLAVQRVLPPPSPWTTRYLLHLHRST